MVEVDGLQVNAIKKEGAVFVGNKMKDNSLKIYGFLITAGV